MGGRYIPLRMNRAFVLFNFFPMVCCLKCPGAILNNKQIIRENIFKDEKK